MVLEYTDCAALIPPSKRGRAKIVHDAPDQLTRMRAACDGQPLYRDKYVRLFVGGNLVMTDAEFERATNQDVIRRAKGHALIAGLGIGLILAPLSRKCKSVTVVEIEPDVIAIVGAKFPGCQIVNADINNWTPPTGTLYDTIYFDIWPNICEDDILEAVRLEQKFRRCLKPRGFMSSWTRYANQAMRRYRR